jgi:hypothetical protein
VCPVTALVNVRDLVFCESGRAGLPLVCWSANTMAVRWIFV